MNYENPEIEKGRLLNLHASGVMTEEQLLGFLYASWVYMIRYTKDRRGANAAKGVDHKTGLPNSADDLMPTHRAVRGRPLALSTVMPPKSFVLSILRTDEIEENAVLGHDSPNREWRCLAMVPPDTWSEDTVNAVEVNTHRFRILLNKLEAVGLVNCRPMIDDTGQTLGTKNLEKHEDEALGFRPTNKGLDAAERFVQEHTHFARTLRLEEWLGHSMVRQVPQWKQAEERNATA